MARSTVPLALRISRREFGARAALGGVASLAAAHPASARMLPQQTASAAAPVHEPPFQSRPVVMGRNGAASTPHPIASAAAIDVMKAGGNAMDAAVAAAAVAAVVQPVTGGVGYFTVYNASKKKVDVLEFCGRTPAALRAAMFPYRDGMVDVAELERQRKNLLATLTPGAVAGWEEMLARHGTWTLERALQPAIDLAENGFPVSYSLHARMASQRERLLRWPESARTFLNNGVAYAPGEVLRQKDLAATLTRIGRRGSEELYRGDTGRSIVRFMEDQGGAMRADDLAKYRPRRLDPISVEFRGHRICAAPPPASDAVCLEGLNIISLFDQRWKPEDAEYVHASVEAFKLGRTDRIRYIGDPDFVDVPIDRLISLDHARRQQARIRMDRASQGDPAVESSDGHTIQFCVVDRDGNAVNSLQTIQATFGNGVVVPATGITLNSMLYINPGDAALPNAIRPGRRVEMNPLSVMVFRDGRLLLMVGSPGGKTIIQTVQQMIVNVIDFGMNIQQAIDAPRFLTEADGRTLSIESPLVARNPSLPGQLEALGHRVSVIPSRLGSGQGIYIDPASGTRMGGSDFRSEAYSLAY